MTEQKQRRKPRKYTDEFKQQLVELYRSGKRRCDICREYDIATSLFDKWVKQASNSGSFHEKDNRTPEQEELIRLRKENQQLRMENDILKQMEELIDIEDDIAEIDDEFQIVVSGWSVYVESLNLTLRQGISCVWDAEEGLFMPDFDVTIVYEGNIETQEWLYYEQDGMIVTLGNWLNGRLSCEQIEQLWCELIIPEQNKEQKESEE